MSRSFRRIIRMSTCASRSGRSARRYGSSRCRLSGEPGVRALPPRPSTRSSCSTEIVISPLAKGNAYASSVVTNHSSDIKTMEELLGLPTINNPIATNAVFATGGFATVPGSNDLSDLFVANAVPEPASLSLVGVCALATLRRRKH